MLQYPLLLSLNPPFKVLDTVDQTSLHPVWRADSGAPPTASGSANAQAAFPQETELKALQI